VKRIFGVSAVVAALFAVGSISAVAATPVASTGAAINVTKTSATLTGYVDPTTITAYYFVYGTGTSYGQQTAPQPAPSGSGVTLVQANVSGLTANTPYHFQLEVVVGAPPYASTLGGGDQTFQTTSNSGGGGGSGSGSLRLVGKKLSVHNGKASISLWCLSSSACRGTLAISASGKGCVSGKFFSIAAQNAKTIKARVSKACRTLLRDSSKHRIGARLTATPSTGQATLSKKVTLRKA
jgi:hypothetical protein